MVPMASYFIAIFQITRVTAVDCNLGICIEAGDFTDGDGASEKEVELAPYFPQQDRDTCPAEPAENDAENAEDKWQDPPGLVDHRVR